MSSLASLFIGRKYRWLLYTGVWLILFVAALAGGLVITLSQLDDHVRRDREAELARIADMRAHVVGSLERLNREASAKQCSEQLLAAMERIAFLPDGLNTFLYAPGGVVRCSTSHARFDPPVSLGHADINHDKADGLKLWVNRDLSQLTHVAPTGTIAALGDFAVVVPPHKRSSGGTPWLDSEVVVVARNGRVWNVAGADGVYPNAMSADGAHGLSSWLGLGGVSCDGLSRHCVASRVDVLAWAREWQIVLWLLAALAAVVAWLGTSYVAEWLNRYWSFEARFSRHMENVVVHYQPVVNLRTGAISGCEVLARWRDVDGAIVSPDRFLHIVEETQRTAEFTRLVVDRAYRELHENLPDATRLQVNFNVFTRDLETEMLPPIFARFNDGAARFRAAVELLENQDVAFDYAQGMIQELKSAGLKVYIDDFGIGYSSIERAATLAVDGVKLDRTFAMAPPHSILDRLLVQILDMLKVSGREVVVEGVETPERLELLRSTGNVDFAQGYAISRPIPIKDFVAFVRRGWRGASLDRSKLSAAS